MVTSILKKVGEFIRSGKADNGCKVCGVCCELYGPTVKASGEDIARWRREGRDDIIAWLSTDGDNRPDGCPFLASGDSGKRFCSVQATKPQMCRAYPTKAHGGWCVMRAKHETGD